MTAATVQPRVLPARGLGRGPRLAISLLGLLSLYTGGAGTRPAAAQPSAVPLPVVIYPSRDPDTAPPDRSSSAVPPAPPRGIGEAEPEPYVLVDGVWGYWDRAGHFHRRPALIGRAPPFNRIATHGENGFDQPGRPRVETLGRSVPRTTVVLPNPPSRAIVIPSLSPRRRDLTRVRPNAVSIVRGDFGDRHRSTRGR